MQSESNTNEQLTMRNILDAIYDIVCNENIFIGDYTTGNTNQMNANGDILEMYIKDLFAGTYDITNPNKKQRMISETFSYLGSANNPPDAMLKGGDAIEVKKMEKPLSGIALNSSYPKDVLHSDNPKINRACREAEDWDVKDIIYTVGVIPKASRKISALAFVYGTDFCASKNIYERILNSITEGIKNIEDIEFTESNELAHVNNVDPLNLTYFRARGMWGIKSPFKHFQPYFDVTSEENASHRFNFMAIINNQKLESFPNCHLIEEMKNRERFKISDIVIPSPNNPAQNIEAKLLTYYK